jgi:hypothetical protein
VVFAGNDFFRYGATLLIMSTFSPGTFPPPQSFIVQTDIEAAAWIDKGLLPFRRESEGVLVGEIVPSGFDAYARVFHPARRYFGPSIEQSTALPWSEIAAARGKTVHPEMQIEALVDNRDGFDYAHWKAISSGGGEWFPPHECLEETEALALAGLLRPFTTTPNDVWFMLWDGYGDLGRHIDSFPSAMIHPDRSGARLPPELTGRTPALRHYLVSWSSRRAHDVVSLAYGGAQLLVAQRPRMDRRLRDRRLLHVRRCVTLVHRSGPGLAAPRSAPDRAEPSVRCVGGHDQRTAGVVRVWLRAESDIGLERPPTLVGLGRV